MNFFNIADGILFTLNADGSLRHKLPLPLTSEDQLRRNVATLLKLDY